MSLIVHIKVFNDILDQFFDYLETEFEDFKSDIVLTRSAIEFIRQSNPRLVVEQFMTMIEPYKHEVHDCNEDFFLHFKLNPNGGVPNDKSLLCVKVRKIWMSKNINNTHKAHIWLFFHKMIKSGEKVCPPK